MQYIQYKNTAEWQLNRLVESTLWLSLCLFLGTWQHTKPVVDYLDRQFFSYLNGSLNYSYTWRLCWGYLSHPNETWLNMVWMFGLNIVAVFSIPRFKRQHAFAMVIYFWFAFQLALLVTHKIFFDWLEITRASPSLVMDGWVNLQDALGINVLKVASANSFPAGHALVLVYWLRFTNLYCARWVKYLSWSTVLILLLPRLISGAHWLSDIVFTVFYARLWFDLMTCTPWYTILMARIEGMLAGMLHAQQQHSRSVAGY